MIAIKKYIPLFILITIVAYIAIGIVASKNLVSPIFDLKFNFLLQFIRLL